MASGARGVNSTWTRWTSTCAWPPPKATCAAARPAPIRVLQPELAYRLRDRKLEHLTAAGAGHRLGNIGCIQHLQSGTATPVRHWVEVLDDALG